MLEYLGQLSINGTPHKHNQPNMNQPTMAGQDTITIPNNHDAQHNNIERSVHGLHVCVCVG